jgi:phospholipase D1/2
MDSQGHNNEAEEPALFTADNSWKSGRADHFSWLIDGEEYFAALRESLEKAEHEILIVGWDIDSKVELIRDSEHEYYPSPLAETLEALVERKPSLNVFVLSWDFAFVYMLERETLPAYRFGWRNNERLHFQLDGEHATGASHHQKIVVVDGVLAYLGGLDLTKSRWDTRAHAKDDTRRVNTDGESYRPFHDVQAIVSGAPAAWLRELVADRWQSATSSALPDFDDYRPPEAGSIWPSGVPVRGEKVSCCVARTYKHPDGGESIAEVEQLFIDMISAARQTIYIENQYFTAPVIADALAARLVEENGPEIVIVLPGETSGWLEQATMEMRRTQLLDQLVDQDRFNRLRVLAPVCDELEDDMVNVHAKVMVVDDRWLRIGSANLSCRSLGLDSECDLVVEDRSGRLAASFRADLIAEHLGCDIEEVRTATDERGLIHALTTCGGRDRRLERVTIAPEDYSELLKPLADIADMEKPLESFWEDSAAEADADTKDAQQDRPVLAWIGNKSGWLFLVALVVVIVGWTLWSATNSGEDIDPRKLLESLRQSATHPLAPLLAIPAIVAGSLVVAPITGMIAICALLFTPWVASLTGIIGTLAATVVNYFIGTRLGRVVESHAPKPLAERMRSLGSNADAWSLAGLRLIPIAPFTIVNLLAGAFQVRLRDFIIGTLVGMGPGIVVICLSVDRARAALSGEPVFDPWILGAIALAGASIIAFRVWQNRKRA